MTILKFILYILSPCETSNNFVDNFALLPRKMVGSGMSQRASLYRRTSTAAPGESRRRSSRRREPSPAAPSHEEEEKEEQVPQEDVEEA